MSNGDWSKKKVGGIGSVSLVALLTGWQGYQQVDAYIEKRAAELNQQQEMSEAVEDLQRMDIPAWLNDFETRICVLEGGKIWRGGCKYKED